jgi:light-regulated signal transduction histidine kinase (bacteriophytochrome)
VVFVILASSQIGPFRIGLVLCKGMIEQNNGVIRVESKAGEVTTFYIELPRELK